MTNDDSGEKSKGKHHEMTDVALSLGLFESIDRHGKANAEFIKTYRGVDHETGKVFARSHRKISEYAVHEEFRASNLKQQSGFSAEEAAKARYNAKRIIERQPDRMLRTEDAGFGANDTVHDHVKTVRGEVIPGSGSQMKFVSDIDGQLRKIAEGRGAGKNDHSRYLNSRLDLPSDQAEHAKAVCGDRAVALCKEADRLEKNGKIGLSQRKRQQAKNYETLKKNIRDSSVSSEEALEYRTRPLLATSKDIRHVSHQAGLKGAGLGAVLGGCAAVVTNFVLVASGDKSVDDAIADCASATLKASASGYATAFTGAAITGLMRQAASEQIRRLANTNLPGMAVTVCLSLTDSTKRLVSGTITLDSFIEEIGRSGTNLLTSASFATAAQLLIPIPVVGAMIGGIVGYSLSSIFYDASTQAFRSARESKREYLALKQFCREAKLRLEAERNCVESIIAAELDRRRANTEILFSAIDYSLVSGNIDDLCLCVNRFAEASGHHLDYVGKEEFDHAMQANQPLKI